MVYAIVSHYVLKSQTLMVMVAHWFAIRIGAGIMEYVMISHYALKNQPLVFQSTPK